MELVTNLYLSDSISHVLLDKAETIIIQSVGCPKRKETKRHLIVTTSEAYELFRNDHPDIGLGKSKFAELRPKHILLSSDIPNNVWVCHYQSNITLLLESRHRKCPEIALYSRSEFLPLFVCNTDSEFFSLNTCGICCDCALFRDISTNSNDILRKVHFWFHHEDFVITAQSHSSIIIKIWIV